MSQCITFFQVQVFHLEFKRELEDRPFADRAGRKGRRSERGLGLRRLHPLPACSAKAARPKGRGASNNQTWTEKGNFLFDFISSYFYN